MDFKRTALQTAMGLIGFLFTIAPALCLQAVGAESTPVSDGGGTKFPEFYLAAVGDYPEGFFRDVVVEPGQTLELSVAVGNSGEIPVELRVSKVNAVTAINGGFYAGDELDDPYLVTNWIDLNPLEISLDPGQEHLASFSVSVPADAQPGQYMAGLLAQTADPVAIPNSDILDQIIRYAISISILVPGEINSGFELGDPAISVIETNRRIVVPIDNTGNYLVKPAGEFALSDQSGNVVHQTIVELGSIYTGASTEIWLQVPPQMAGGKYFVDLRLADPESGASSSIERVEVAIPNLAEGAGVSVQKADISPNSDEIVYANVELQLFNGGSQLPATNVTLQVVQNGEVVDDFLLASNQVMLEGDNFYSSRYIPLEDWESGTYTFRIIVHQVDPAGERLTELLNEDLFAEIVVP